MATISNNDIAHAIYLSINEAGDKVSAYKKVVDFLYRKRLLSKSPQILSRLKKIADEKEGKIEARIKSKNPLGAHTKRELSEVLTRRYKVKEVYLKDNIDERLLGGIRVEVGDEIIDLSVKNKLNKLQEHLISNK